MSVDPDFRQLRASQELRRANAERLLADISRQTQTLGVRRKRKIGARKRRACREVDRIDRVRAANRQQRNVRIDASGRIDNAVAVERKRLGANDRVALAKF